MRLISGKHRSRKSRTCTYVCYGDCIDFPTAQDIWHDPDALEIPLATSDETRHVVIGKILGKHWSAIITYRGGRIRIISVRRSRKEEIAFYESERD